MCAAKVRVGVDRRLEPRIEATGVAAAEFKELDAFDMTGPLKGNLFVGAHADPVGKRQVDAFEVEVVARVGQVLERVGAGGFQNGFAGAVVDRILFTVR